MSVVQHQTKLVLGGEATIVIVTDRQRSLEELFGQLWREVLVFEKRFSRFLPGSELSRFNRQAGVQMPISAEFQAVLAACQAMTEMTDNLYNPFILPALQRTGYKQSAVPGYEDDIVDDFSERQVVTPDHLEIGDGWARIPYGTAIDLGGMGKGYLADQLADTLDQAHTPGYWVSLSGDMVLAGHDAEGNNWQTMIQSAYKVHSDAPYYIEHTGKRRTVATSGTFRRENQRTGKPWHHLIDPRTGHPAETDILLATVVHESCLQADVLASCGVIVGSKHAQAYLKKRGVDAGYLQAEKANVISWGSMLRLKQPHEVGRPYA